jgi:DNA-binding MarR family transcriptional regulator
MSTDPKDPVALHREHWPESWDAQVVPFIFVLHRTYERHMARTAAISSSHGLSPSELDVLVTLRRSAAPWVLTPSELQRSLLITSGGLTKVLQQLEWRGLVVRLADSDDRRVKPVQLTAAALPLIEAALAESCSSVRAWLGERLSDAEIEQLTELLGRLGRD